MRPALTIMLLLAANAPLAAQQTVKLPAQDRPLAGTPATLLTVGREEGESWELLSNVSGVDFDARDNLYILDAGNHRVLVIDPRGKLVRTIGKQGGGPGELMVPSGLAVLPDGTIAIADLGRGAVSLFNADGTFRHNVPFADSLGHPLPEQRGSAPSVHAHPNGVALFGGLRMSVGGPGSGAPPSPPADIPVYLRPTDAQAGPRLLYRVPRTPPQMQASGGANNRSVRMTQRAFTPTPAWGVLPDGGIAAVSGASAEYRVLVVDAAGRAQRALTRPLPPRRVTKADQDAAREQMAERMRSGTGMIRMEVRAGGGRESRSISTGGAGDRGPSEEQIRAQLAELEFADVVPAISGLRVDPQGRIWVARPGRRPGGDGPVDLLDASGRYLGTLSPQPLPDAFSRSGLAAYVTVDDLGVEHVVVKRLPAWK